MKSKQKSVMTSCQVKCHIKNLYLNANTIINHIENNYVVFVRKY